MDFELTAAQEEIVRQVRTLCTNYPDEYWREHYRRDAVSLVLELAFDRLNLHSVNLSALATNERAIRCYEKCGFMREGLFRERTFTQGEYVDAVAMGILRADYEKRRAN